MVAESRVRSGVVPNGEERGCFPTYVVNVTPSWRPSLFCVMELICGGDNSGVEVRARHRCAELV